MREMPSDAQVMLRDCSLGSGLPCGTRYRFTPARPDGRSWTGLLPLLLLAANPFYPPHLYPSTRSSGSLGALPSALSTRSPARVLQFPTATRLLCRSPLFALLSFFLHRTLTRTYEAPVTVFSPSRSVTSSVAAARRMHRSS